MQQSIDQRAAIALVVGCSRSGMHHHPGWFVDDREIVVFVNNIEGNVFCDCAQRCDLRIAADGDLLSTTQPQGRLCDRSVDQRHLLFEQLLHPGAAHVWYLGGQELIEALPGCVVGDSNRNGEKRRRHSRRAYNKSDSPRRREEHGELKPVDNSPCLSGETAFSYLAALIGSGGASATRRTHSNPPPITRHNEIACVPDMKPRNSPRPGSPRKNSMKYRPMP